MLNLLYLEVKAKRGPGRKSCFPFQQAWISNLKGMNSKEDDPTISTWACRTGRTEGEGEGSWVPDAASPTDLTESLAKQFGPLSPASSGK